MGYTKQSGRWADTDEVVFTASAARTSSGSSPAVELGDAGTVRLLLDVTASSGSSPTLNVQLETSYDGTANSWRPIGSFPQFTSTGSSRESFGGADRFVRASWTIGGSNPSFTFSLSGEGC